MLSDSLIFQMNKKSSTATLWVYEVVVTKI